MQQQNHWTQQSINELRKKLEKIGSNNNNNKRSTNVMIEEKKII